MPNLNFWCHSCKNENANQLKCYECSDIYFGYRVVTRDWTGTVTADDRPPLYEAKPNPSKVAILPHILP